MWEYKMVYQRIQKNLTFTTDILNEYGRCSWELIEIIPDPTGNTLEHKIFVFKRKLNL